jgi:TolA-binding protein
VEPEVPTAGKMHTVYVDVSNDEAFKFSFPMYMHIESDDGSINNYQMSLDYTKGPSVWSYSFVYTEPKYLSFSSNASDINAQATIIENLPELDSEGSVYIHFNFDSQQINQKTNKEKDVFNDEFYEALLLATDKDYSKAIKSLNLIIDKNKGKRSAAEAEYIIAEIYLNDFNNYSSAAKRYSDIINSYPQSFNVVKKSMFTLAYIYANSLDSYTDAIYYYELFKKEYPGDDLITSIDYELKDLYEHKKIIESLLNSTKQ